MKFYAVKLTRDEYVESDRGEAMIAHAKEASLHRPQYSTHDDEPVILFCNVVTGGFPGIESSDHVYLLNEPANSACKPLNLAIEKTIDHAELPNDYVLLFGEAWAGSDQRKF
jgi:hypothetical protein